MRIFLDCIPCFFSQTLRAARMAGADEKQIKKLFDEIGRMVESIPLESTPPETAKLIYDKIQKITGNIDPYKDIKRKCTEESLELYSLLKEKVEESDDRLMTAIRIAIAGNIIDFGVDRKFIIENAVDEVVSKDFAICDYDKFKYHLDRTDEVIYVGDNAGETVFDRILIEEIKKPVTYVVRDMPVINDATCEDAKMAGLDKVATIVSAGGNSPGLVLKTGSDEIKEIFKNARFVISKGQGNYEGLSNEKNTIFFLLMAKCQVIAKNIGVDEGDIILLGINT